MPRTYRGGSQRPVTVPNTTVVICPANDNRVAIIVGCPIGVSGDRIDLNFTSDPATSGGFPHFFGTAPLVFHQDQFG